MGAFDIFSRQRGAHVADVVPVVPVEAADSPPRVDAEIAAYWDLWAEQIGRALRPDLEGLRERVPTLVSAVVTTVDGRALAVLGLDGAQVDRLASSWASAYGAVGGVVGVLGDASDEPEVVTVQHGRSQTVVVTVPRLVVGTLLLWVTADAASLGVLLLYARSTAADIRAKLDAHEAAGGPGDPAP